MYDFNYDEYDHELNLENLSYSGPIIIYDEYDNEIELEVEIEEANEFEYEITSNDMDIEIRYFGKDLDDDKINFFVRDKKEFVQTDNIDIVVEN